MIVDSKINFAPTLKDYPKMNMKEFIEMNEASRNKQMAEILSKMPAGTRIESPSKGRLGIEKIFEWEH